MAFMSMSFVVRSETESLHLLALITAAVTPRPPFSAPRLFPAQKLLLCIPPSAAAQTLQQQAVHGEGGTTIVAGVHCSSSGCSRI